MRQRLASFLFDRVLRDRVNDLRAEVLREMHGRLLIEPMIFGDPARLTMGANVELNNATINLMSGDVRLGDETFCGFGVSFLTGTHDPAARGETRRKNWPKTGRDIVVGNGVWIASNATILGPCVIGDDAVIAAGALVTRDVRAGTIVAGVPAREVRSAE
jgi:acetyltransferase-like isoleucine patch superfamily enzyme